MTRKIFLFSTSVIWSEKQQQFHEGIPEILKTLSENGIAPVIVSNRSRPEWFSEIAESTQFVTERKRQDGNFIPHLIEINKSHDLSHNEIVVLGATAEDMQMATNSKSLLVRCEWSEEVFQMGCYGVAWKKPATLLKLAKYLDDQIPWYFQSRTDEYKMFALTNAGTYSASQDEVAAANEIRSVLKNGSLDKRNRLLLHMMSSIYRTDEFSKADVFGYYPSSKSQNEGSEIMAEFCRYARENFKKRYKHPIFIRHTAAVARHSRSGDREDPTSQIESIHLNPFYKGKLAGKKVIIMDDYLTYGVSFGVARSLLLKVGAEEVVCMALGKFGSQARAYSIDLGDQDVFAPMTATQYSQRPMTGAIEVKAQKTLIEKFAE